MSEVTYETIMRTECEGMSERLEMMVDIYESADSVRDRDVKSDTNTQQLLQSSGSECVKIRNYRAVTLCLVLLCVLLLTAVTVLCVLITHDKNQFLNQITVLQRRKDQLITQNQNLTKQREELQKYLEMDGWIYKQFSFYFISSEKRSWSESRRYCTERGADLVIINNRQEQDFVQKMSDTKYIWIGLSDSDKEGSWKWVDGSTLNSGFWRPGEPNDGKTENCVLSDSSGWADYPCSMDHRWICEKNIRK